MDLFGIELLGPNFIHKLLLTASFVAVLAGLRWLAGTVAQAVLRRTKNERHRFWTWQLLSIISAVLLVVGLLPIWFDDPRRLTTAMGLITAGIAFALQKVITSLAGYLIILRGRSFTVGDRIAMGKVRGEVIAVGFMQTKVMEMGGQSPGEQGNDSSLWGKSRQFTGRVATVTNDRIFEDPVFNYTQEFPFLWEEISIPIKYQADRRRTEEILLEVAERHTAELSSQARQALADLRHHYTMLTASTQPKVYYRIADNCLELTVRFIADASGTRDLKDAMSREILEALDAAGIGIATATFDIAGLPEIRLQRGSRLEIERVGEAG